MGVEQLRRFREDGDESEGFLPSLTFGETSAVILSVDQSLSSSGWACLVRQYGEVDVRTVGMVKTEPTGERSGFEDSFQRGEAIFREFFDLIEDLGDLSGVVHEMPSTRPARGQKKEAGPVAVMAVRIAAACWGTPVTMLNAQKVKTLLTGAAKAEKADVRRGVEQVLGTEFHRRLEYWNYDVSDAVALGLVALSEEGGAV